MSEISAISAISPASLSARVKVDVPAQAWVPNNAGVSFSDLMSKGAGQVEQKLAEADRLVRAFTLDESIPVHQVTIALEEARYSVELAMQVRQRLVEAYRDIMNMQL
jgi:flagellar hook-basal body complex protein FliE